jgi:hypothetical protein
MLHLIVDAMSVAMNSRSFKAADKLEMDAVGDWGA